MVAIQSSLILSLLSYIVDLSSLQDCVNLSALEGVFSAFDSSGTSQAILDLVHLRTDSVHTICSALAPGSGSLATALTKVDYVDAVWGASSRSSNCSLMTRAYIDQVPYILGFESPAHLVQAIVGTLDDVNNALCSRQTSANENDRCASILVPYLADTVDIAMNDTRNPEIKSWVNLYEADTTLSCANVQNMTSALGCCYSAAASAVAAISDRWLKTWELMQLVSIAPSFGPIGDKLIHNLKALPTTCPGEQQCPALLQSTLSSTLQAQTPNRFGVPVPSSKSAAHTPVGGFPTASFLRAIIPDPDLQELMASCVDFSALDGLISAIESLGIATPLVDSLFGSTDDETEVYLGLPPLWTTAEALCSAPEKGNKVWTELDRIDFIAAVWGHLNTEQGKYCPGRSFILNLPATLGFTEPEELVEAFRNLVSIGVSAVCSKGEKGGTCASTVGPYMYHAFSVVVMVDSYRGSYPSEASYYYSRYFPDASDWSTVLRAEAPVACDDVSMIVDFMGCCYNPMSALMKAVGASWMFGGGVDRIVEKLVNMPQSCSSAHQTASCKINTFQSLVQPRAPTTPPSPPPSPAPTPTPPSVAPTPSPTTQAPKTTAPTTPATPTLGKGSPSSSAGLVPGHLWTISCMVVALTSVGAQLLHAL